jgi:hypothetical protein
LLGNFHERQQASGMDSDSRRPRRANGSDKITNHVIASRKQNRKIGLRVKYWETIADNLKKRGWSWGCVSAVAFRGERPGLLTHIATGSVSLCVQMKS